ncbi:MAG: COX15/CtaA family protein [Actinomycetales bacterium]|nr:COX15/CtaA family protein [Actinomycetales bacterium]
MTTPVPTITAAAAAPAEPRVRVVYLANLVAQMGIIVTGAVVRLTGSGLGCPTWPECVEGSYVPTARQEEAWHKYVEFGNRMLTFVLVVLAIAAVVAAIWDQRRRVRAGLPARPVLLALAFVPIVGTFAQAILGGITVLTGLHPLTVSAHFLVSMGIVAGCVALVTRSRDSGDRPIVLLVRGEVRILTWALVCVAAVVVILGVLVTGSGPHSGDAQAEHRFGFDPRTVAWLHADVVLFFLGLLVALLLALRLTDAPRRAQRAALVVLVVALAQGSVGYLQYFTGLPILLVGLHVLGAVCLWVAVLLVLPTQRDRGIGG